MKSDGAGTRIVQAIGIGARVGGIEVGVARREPERAVQRAGVVDVQRRVDDSWRRTSDRDRRLLPGTNHANDSSSW